MGTDTSFHVHWAAQLSPCSSVTNFGGHSLEQDCVWQGEDVPWKPLRVFGVTSFFWEWNIYHLINQKCGFIGHLCDRSHQKRRGKNPSAVACTRESEDRMRDTQLKDCFPFSWALAWFCHQLCQGLWGLSTSPCSHCSSSCWESPKPHLNSCYLKHFPRNFLSLLHKYFT